MSKLCLNCNRTIPDTREFCTYCQEKLDKMVDRKELESHEQIETTQNTNPFFNSSRVTGRIAEQQNDTVSSLVEEDDQSSDTFWIVVLGIVFLMVLMVQLFS